MVDLFPFRGVAWLVHEVPFVAGHRAKGEHLDRLELNNLDAELLRLTEKDSVLEQNPVDVEKTWQVTSPHLSKQLLPTILETLFDLHQNVKDDFHVVHVSGQAAVQRMNVDLALALPVFVHEALKPLLELVEAVLVTSEWIRAVSSTVRVAEIVHELHVLGHRSEV